MLANVNRKTFKSTRSIRAAQARFSLDLASVNRINRVAAYCPSLSRAHNCGSVMALVLRCEARAHKNMAALGDDFKISVLRGWNARQRDTSSRTLEDVF
ncbi:hypothetical protein QQF64_003304 [Cirrhinus molitorella]|uniref:Uncharacterized protein n=1 Tax=Cirrhinus molitorella TaxID=172907 RepID=A0ABR3MJP0_9TELE